MEKIKEYKAGQRGDRGTVVTLPRVWLTDVGMAAGDDVEVFRDSDHELGDVLIIRRKK